MCLPATSVRGAKKKPVLESTGFLTVGIVPVVANRRIA
jgi:hypothetical protein